MGRRGEEGKNEVSSVKTEVLRSTAASVLSSRGASVLHTEQWEREMGSPWTSLAQSGCYEESLKGTNSVSSLSSHVSSLPTETLSQSELQNSNESLKMS